MAGQGGGGARDSAVMDYYKAITCNYLVRIRKMFNYSTFHEPILIIEGPRARWAKPTLSTGNRITVRNTHSL